MLAIESLFGSNLFGQLRTIIHMPSSPDIFGPSLAGRDPECHRQEPALPPTTKIQPQDMATHAPQPPPSTTRSRRKRPRITRPDPGSLYDIMHENAGTSLYVLPICWTDLHAQVLGARFRKQPAITTPVPDHDPAVWLEPSHMARNLTSELHVLVRDQPAVAKAFSKTRAIKHVMAALFPDTLSHPKVGVELDMYFGTRVFRKAIRIPCLWKTPNGRETSFDSTTTMPLTSFGRLPTPPDNDDPVLPNKPMLAYISRSTLATTRRHLFRVVRGPNDSPNEVVARLQRLRSKMLIPENIDHDSFFVGMIIAMAQAHFYRSQSSKSSQGSSSPKGCRSLRMPPPQFHDVKIQIITHEEDESSPNFIIYTAIVTATFLERFMYPHKAPLPQEQMEAGDAGLKIDYTPVSFWPVLGLKERLAKALGREIAGETLLGNPEHIGLWDPLVQQPPQPSPAPPESLFPKRRPGPPVYCIGAPSFGLTPLLPSARDTNGAPSLKSSLKRRRRGSSHRDREQLRPALSEMLDSSFEETTTPDSSADDLDRPVLSPDAKRRRTAASSHDRGSRSRGSTPSAPNPLEVC